MQSLLPIYFNICSSYSWQWQTTLLFVSITSPKPHRRSREEPSRRLAPCSAIFRLHCTLALHACMHVLCTYFVHIAYRMCVRKLQSRIEKISTTPPGLFKQLCLIKSFCFLIHSCLSQSSTDFSILNNVVYFFKQHSFKQWYFKHRSNSVNLYKMMSPESCATGIISNAYICLIGKLSWSFYFFK